MNSKHLFLALAALLSIPASHASTVIPEDPQPGGVEYKNTVILSGIDEATFDSHVGPWSWDQDDSAADPEDTTGWTHTSTWTALELTEPAYLTVRLARKAGVPWPAAGNPDRKAATNAMFPSFTIWKNWDNDAAPAEYASFTHEYNGRGNVNWAEDLVYLDHLDNSTLEVVERTYALLPGKYTIVQGSNAPTNDPSRQGYSATFITATYVPPQVKDDAYFTLSHSAPITVAAASGVSINDLNLDDTYSLEVVKQPTYGQVTLAADGSFTYVPGPYYGEAGMDSFTYRAIPGGDASKAVGPATVAISTFGSAAGTYTGLVKDAGTSAIGGLLKLTVSKTGTYTGIALIGAKRSMLRGKLAPDGSTIVTASPKMPELTLRLSAEAGRGRHFTARLSGTAPMWGEIEQSPYSRFFAAPMAGVHKVTMVPASTGAELPPKNGTATLRITASGIGTLSGKLGDNTSFAVASGLITGTNAGPTLPVFSALYAKKAGQIGGNLTFGASAEAPATGTLTAVRPPAPSGAFKAGFTLDYSATTAPHPAVGR